jgi:ABC-type multidrug transport system fused ATPase/permease subunit
VLDLLGRGAVRWLVFASIGSVAAAAIEFWVANLLRSCLRLIGVVDGAVTRNAAPDVHVQGPQLALTLVVLAVLRALAQYVVLQSTHEVGDRVTSRLRRLAVRELLRTPPSVERPVARISSMVVESFARAGHAVHLSSQLANVAAQVLVLGVLMFATAARETLLSMAGLGVMGGMLFLLNRRGRSIVGELPALHEAMLAGILNVARNLTLVRVLRTERRELTRLLQSVDNHELLTLRALAYHNAAIALAPFFGLLLMVFFIVSSQALFGTSTFALLSFLYLFMRFVLLLGGGVSYYSHLSLMLPHVRQTAEYLDQLTPEALHLGLQGSWGDDEAASAASEEAPFGAPDLQVRGVAFSYPGASPLLRDLSFDLPAAHMVAIVGPNGCGKSTLLSLLLGLLSPSSGIILFAGRAPRAFFDDPRVRVGYVGAEPFFLDGTMRDNLRYGARRAVSDEALWVALRDAGCEALVRRHPEGLDARVSADGAGFSSGEKQRLCLVRALVGEPHVLVLDEVSANLDLAAEQEISGILGTLRGRCTILLVTHRRGVLRHTDMTLDLDARTASISARPRDERPPGEASPADGTPA